MLEKLLQFRAWLSKVASTNPHWLCQVGAASMGSLIDFLVLGVVGLILIFQFAPIFEDQATDAAANVSNATVSTFATLSGWLFPLLAIIGLIYVGVRFIRGKKGSQG